MPQNQQKKSVKKKAVEETAMDSDKDFSELLKEREKKNGIDKELKEIYEDDSAVITGKGNDQRDMSILEHRDNPWKRIAVTFLILLFVLSAISWISFFIFNLSSKINPDDLQLEIAGPREVIAGQEVIYEIKYKNLSKVNLKDIELRMDYPWELIFIDSAPTYSANGADSAGKLAHIIWQMDEIAAKRSGRIEVKAKIISPINIKHDISLVLNYRPENFSSTFSQEAKIIAEVKGVGIQIEVEAPTMFNVGAEEEITVSYIQQKESYIDNFKIVLEAEEEFVISGDNKEGIWQIDNLSDKQEKLIIKGIYEKKSGNENIIKLIFATPVETALKDDLADGEEPETAIEYYVFKEIQLSPQVVEGELNLTMSINSSTANKAVNAGDVLNYVIHYQNSSDVDLEDLIIMAGVDSRAVDWGTLKNDYKGEVNKTIITWTKEEISELEELAPDEEGSFGFSLTVKSLDDLKYLSAKDYQIKSFLDYSVDSAIKSDSDAHTVEIINKINSDLKFSNTVRYFDQSNVAVGSGPLPPKVGEKTSYRIYWTLTNSLHDLEKVQAYVMLPDNVSWEGEADRNMGGLNYKNDNREISWVIDSWDAISEPAIAEFSVSITPAEDDKNKIITLLNKVNVEAKDKETQGFINLSSKAKTTALEDDEVGKGYGKVE